ncbi:hypothetical protein QVD99_001091 [Batrachochytrium dendrobatidis]|nr:hypothetical protein O5D80_001118 [Batrachochytrium dendrobatidis]KAK5672323.1 hypothetical protein QVD99_001091 [Batrachochytrium dendrobatidis]
MILTPSFSAILLLITTQYASLVLGQCSSTYMRSEFRQLSEASRQAYLTAVNQLKLRARGGTEPATWNLDQFVESHMSNSGAFHGTAQFLPWHRVYLRYYEEALRQVSKDPNMSVPYWDWTLDASAPASSLILSPNYFGSAGVAPDYCVSGGVAKSWPISYPFTSKCLTRCSSWSALYPPTAVNAILTRSSTYGAFRHDLEAIPHALIHTSGGGSCVDTNNNPAPFTSMASPNDPLFFIHHANVDRLWWRWQVMCPANAELYDEPNTSLSEALTTWNIPVSSAMNIANSRFCYTYSAANTDSVNFSPVCKSPTNSTGPPTPSPVATNNPAAWWFNNLMLQLVPNAPSLASTAAVLAPAPLPIHPVVSVIHKSIPSAVPIKNQHNAAPTTAPTVAVPTVAAAAINPDVSKEESNDNTNIDLNLVRRNVGSISVVDVDPNDPGIVSRQESSTSQNTTNVLTVNVRMYVPSPGETTYQPAPYVSIKAPDASDRTDLFNLRFPPAVPDSYLVMCGLDIQRARAAEVRAKHIIDYYNNVQNWTSPVALVEVVKNANGFYISKS